MAVTGIDSTNKNLTVTRGANGTTAAPHNAGDPVFTNVPSFTLFANGATGSFQGGGNTLPAPPPDGLTYALTLRVTAPGASGSSLVYDGMGLDPNHPNYLQTVLGQTPPRPIDALQNQVQFTVGSSLTAQQLFTELFPIWGGPASTSPKTYTFAKVARALSPGTAVLNLRPSTTTTPCNCSKAWKTLRSWPHPDRLPSTKHRR